MDWKNYEAITKYIYETLGKESGVKIEGYGNNCKVKGKSGVEHQIDVLTNHSDGIHSYRTAIECKYWKQKVNKDIVMKVSNIIKDAGINKGVIVSKQGFTQDGISFAKYKNIGLVELKEMEKKDWVGRGRILSIKSWVRRPKILNVIIDNVGEKKMETENVVIDTVKVELNNGKKLPLINYLKTFKMDLHKEKENRIIRKTYPLKGANLINEQTNSRTPINEITFIGVLTIIDANIKFKPVDQIWLIMKSIFEERSFTISQKGVIRED